MGTVNQDQIQKEPPLFDNQDKTIKRNIKENLKSNGKTNSAACNIKTCKIKKRGPSITSQIKTIHNKSEIGLKGKKCMHRKEKNSKDNMIPKLTAPLSEHILIKTF